VGVQSNMTTKRYRYAKDRDSLLARLKKIEGQAKGVRDMIEDGRYCLDIVQQLSALSAAADEVGILVLENHIEGCVAEAIREEHGEEQIKELMKTIRKAIRR
jgi:CsoR family transcriptional regulator, copper-sensing transcriptional repressor